MGLFKPAWMSRNVNTASKGVSKTEDEATLVRIVREARLASARLYAARKLSGKGMCDEGYWRELASSHGDRDVRILAASNVDDVDFLGDFLSRPENLDANGMPNWDLKQKHSSAVVKAHREATKAHIRKIDGMEDPELLSQIAMMDDAAVEERFGRSKLEGLPAVREHALARLLELGGDGAYRMLAREDSIDEYSAVCVVRDLEDDQLLYRIASDGKARRALRIAAIGTTRSGKGGSRTGIANIDLLGKLAMETADDEVREAAARKLQNLPCRDGQLHHWVCVSDDVREHGEHCYGTRRYVCEGCGNEYEERVSERF